MDKKLIRRRTASSPVWINCYSEKCKGEEREFQVVSVIGNNSSCFTIYRCVECGSHGRMTIKEIANLTGDLMTV